MKVILRYGVAMDGGAIAVPSTFIVSKDGVIRWHYVGETQADRPTHAQLLEHLDKLQ